MIIWKGRGILIALFAIAGLFVGAALNSSILAAWGAAAGAWIFALTVGKTTQQVLVDPQTQQPVVFKRVHTLYFLPPKFWAFLLTIVAVLITVAPRDEMEEGSETAQAAFKAADSQISSVSKGGINGNTPEAAALAKEFAVSAKTFREMFIEKGKDDEFPTYVHLTPSQCVFMLHVPQLRKFSDDAKQTMAQIAWANAQELVAELNPKPSKIALGIRGSLLYDRAYIGHPATEDEASKGIDQEVKGTDAKYAMIRLFEPDTGAPKTADAGTAAAPGASPQESNEAPASPEPAPAPAVPDAPAQP